MKAQETLFVSLKHKIQAGLKGSSSSVVCMMFVLRDWKSYNPFILLLIPVTCCGNITLTTRHRAIYIVIKYRDF